MAGPREKSESVPGETVEDLASVGFQALPPGDDPLWEVGPGRAPPVRPTPLPKRPKGRLFVGSILLVICGLAAYQGFSVFLRYRAYGIVTGRIIKVSAPFDSAVQYVHVQEGDHVRQGQLIMTLENLELQHELAQTQDALRIAQATLTAEMSKIRWDFDEHFDRSRKAAADYYETWGQLLDEQAKHDGLILNLRRAEDLKEQNTITQEEFDEAFYAEHGQREKVEKLSVALEEHKTRWKVLDRSEDDGYDQLQPTLVRIESLQAQLVRLRESLSRGEIRAPVHGVVVKRHRFAGERAEAQQPVFSILEEGSLNIVVYLPQRSSAALALGVDVEVVVEPNAQPATCHVVRIGDQYQPAPANIARYYQKDEKLLPVFLHPKDELRSWLSLHVGSVVKLSRF